MPMKLDPWEEEAMQELQKREDFQALMAAQSGKQNVCL